MMDRRGMWGHYCTARGKEDLSNKVILEQGLKGVRYVISSSTESVSPIEGRSKA